jgi:uncharacterized membrane protein
MDSRTIAYALYGWVATAVVVGSVLIVFGSTLLATVGAVVIIVGLVSLMPAFSYLWWESESDSVASAEAAEAVEAIEATEAAEATEQEGAT